MIKEKSASCHVRKDVVTIAPLSAVVGRFAYICETGQFDPLIFEKDDFEKFKKF